MQLNQHRFLSLLLLTILSLMFSMHIYICSNNLAFRSNFNGEEQNHSILLEGIISDERDPNFPYKKMNLTNNIMFNLIIGNTIYNDQAAWGRSGHASRILYPLEKFMVNEMRQHAITYLRQIQGDFNSMDISCEHVLYRVVPTKGIESQVICELPVIKKIEKVFNFQPFEPMRSLQHNEKDITLSESSSKQHANLNIIVPLQGRAETLQIFLDNLQDLTTSEAFISSGLVIGLTIVYFNDLAGEAIYKIYKEFKKKNAHIVSHCIALPYIESRLFSRSGAIHRGLSKSKVLSSLVFVTDVDIFFDLSFLKRCIAIPIAEKQIYFPAMFSLFNPDFEGMRDLSLIERPTLQEDDGQWRFHSFGMVCGHKSDFDTLDAYSEDFYGWGKEDVHLVNMISENKQYKIIRTLDPGLLHLYHEKKCSEDETEFEDICLKIKYMSEASLRRLGKWFFQYKDLVENWKQNPFNSSSARDENRGSSDSKPSQNRT